MFDGLRENDGAKVDVEFVQGEVDCVCSGQGGPDTVKIRSLELLLLKERRGGGMKDGENDEADDIWCVCMCV